MLYVKGYALNCDSMEFKRKDGSGTFKSHRSFVYDKSAGSKPIEIDTGEIGLEIGKCYRIPVYASLYKPENGSPVIQYKTLKNHPPEEIVAK